jgi:hypothetical protein
MKDITGKCYKILAVSLWFVAIILVFVAIVSILIPTDSPHPIFVTAPAKRTAAPEWLIPDCCGLRQWWEQFWP